MQDQIWVRGTLAHGKVKGQCYSEGNDSLLKQEEERRDPKKDNYYEWNDSSLKQEDERPDPKKVNYYGWDANLPKHKTNQENADPNEMTTYSKHEEEKAQSKNIIIASEIAAWCRWRNSISL